MQVEKTTTMNKKNYFLDFDFPAVFEGVGKFVATSKARYDVTKIVTSSFNAERIVISRTSDNKVLGVLQVILKLFVVLKRLSKGSILFIQYPFVNLNVFKYIAPLFLRHRTIALIHDLPSYRYDNNKGGTIKDEVKVLNCFKDIIVHSENMKERLLSDGVTSSIHILGVFDYLLDTNQHIKHEKNIIVFAGGLKKSLFLKNLRSLPMKNIAFNLYGTGLPNEVETQKIKYKGIFKADDITAIAGDWGLLWDGNSISTCTGNYGRYLRIIAPHKLSLYIACGLKVIVWENSAMANFVVENGIGFTISSLYEIEEKISSLSVSQILTMNENVHKLSVKVRTGEYLKRAISEALSS